METMGSSRDVVQRRLGPAAPALLLLALLTLGCGADGERSAPVARPSVRAEVTLLEVRSVPRDVEAIGSVHPRVRVSPGTKIMGRVERVFVAEGDRVEAGQVLAALEQRDLEAALAQARAAVLVGQADLENAGSQFRRMSGLHDRGSVTDKTLEDATSGFRIAEARLAQARAHADAAEVHLAYARVVSPIRGRVTSKLIEAGDMAAPGMPLFTLEDTTRVKVVVQLSESDAVGLRVGDAARVRVDVLGRDWETTIARVLPAGDPATRTFQVELELANPGGELRSGMFARAFVRRGARQALIVPQAAVVTRGPLAGVFVVEGASARLRWVRLGTSIDGGVEVLSGLSAGERIVGHPEPGLVDGTPVEAR